MSSSPSDAAGTGTSPNKNASSDPDAAAAPTLFTGFSYFNFINILAYAVNITITYGFGNAGWANRPNNGELSDKYQTIVTPNSQAFLIWTLIFLLQAVWAVWQLVVPSQRKHPCVMAVGYKYVMITIFQCCWTFSFTWEVIWLSLVFMLLLCASLIATTLSLIAVDKSFRGWCIWQFPISLHAGWILAATALNFNVTLVAYGASVNSQIGVAGACLVVLLGAAMWFLKMYPVDLTPPCVIAWALGWIYYELANPLESIVERFTEKQITGFQYGAIAGVGAILFSVVCKALYVVLVQRRKKTTQEAHTGAPVSAEAADTNV